MKKYTIQQAVYIKPLGIAVVHNGDHETFSLGGFREHEDLEPLYLYPQSSDEEWREKAVWGSFGKDGDQPLRYRKVKDLDREHLQAIVDTQKHLEGFKILEVIKYWLAKKNESDQK